MKKILLVVAALFCLNASGQTGASLNFDGNGYAVVNTGTTTVNNAYTIEMWVNPSTLSSNGNALFSTRTSTTDFSTDVAFGNNGGQIHADIGNGSGWLTTSANATYSFTTGTWYHVAYAVSSSGYTVYINGASIGSGTYTGTPVLIDPSHTFITLGAVQETGGTFGGSKFMGSMDEV